VDKSLHYDREDNRGNRLPGAALQKTEVGVSAEPNNLFPRWEKEEVAMLTVHYV
jgi:hypothetical protein